MPRQRAQPSLKIVPETGSYTDPSHVYFLKACVTRDHSPVTHGLVTPGKSKVGNHGIATGHLQHRWKKDECQASGLCGFVQSSLLWCSLWSSSNYAQETPLHWAHYSHFVNNQKQGSQIIYNILENPHPPLEYRLLGSCVWFKATPSPYNTLWHIVGA